MKCLIYKITCLVTNKIYIGSTSNKGVREKSHFSRLRKGTHTNKYLQAAYNKYGEGNFTFEVIDECDIKDRYAREQYWISDFKSCDGKFGFNLSVSSKSNVDAALLWADPEFRKTQPVKISETMIELCKNEEVRRHRKSISNEYWGTDKAKEKVSKRMLAVWASLPEEERNKRIKRFAKPREIINYITFKGVTKPLIEWSELSGLPRSRLLERLKRGVTGEMMFAPLRKIKPKPEFIEEWLDGKLPPIFQNWQDPEYKAANISHLKEMTRRRKMTARRRRFHKMKRIMANVEEKVFCDD